MSDVLKGVIEGLKELFPEAESMEFTLETELGAVPDWDSMAAVNFQTFIEQRYQVSVPQDLLGEETSIEEVITFITHPEKMEETAA